MMEDCPVKFRILEFLEGKELRTDEIVLPIAKERPRYDTAYGRAMIKYDIIELVSAGLVLEGESVIDEGILEKGKLLTKYKISDLGQTYLNELKQKVRV